MQIFNVIIAHEHNLPENLYEEYHPHVLVFVIERVIACIVEQILDWSFVGK